MRKQPKETRKQIEIVEDAKYQFTAATPTYGRAWFVFCPIWKRGKIVEVFIYPRAQKEATGKYYYHAALYGRSEFSVQSWEGLDNPFIWTFAWCKEHRCANFGVYVPNGAEWFQLSCGGIYFG